MSREERVLCSAVGPTGAPLQTLELEKSMMRSWEGQVRPRMVSGAGGLEVRGLLFGLLTDADGREKMCSSRACLEKLVEMGMEALEIVRTLLETLLDTPMFERLKPVPRDRIVWLVGQLVRVPVKQMDEVMTLMMRQMEGGCFSTSSMAWCQSVVRFLNDRAMIDYLIEQPLLLQICVASLLRVMHSHMTHASQLCEEEENLLLVLIQRRPGIWTELGSDGVRLFRSVRSLPKMTSLWQQLINSDEFERAVSCRTPRAVLRSRLVPAAEKKLIFILRETQQAQMARYMEWFLARFVKGVDRDGTAALDIARFVCCCFHPESSIVNSNITQRYAVLGFFFYAFANDPSLVQHLCKCMFYDWFTFNMATSNVMDLQPAALLMVSSVPKYRDITIALMDSLVHIAAQFQPESMRPFVNTSIQNALQCLRQNAVVKSFAPLQNHELLRDVVLSFSTAFPAAFVDLPSSLNEAGEVHLDSPVNSSSELSHGDDRTPVALMESSSTSFSETSYAKQIIASGSVGVDIHRYLCQLEEIYESGRNDIQNAPRTAAALDELLNCIAARFSDIDETLMQVIGKSLISIVMPAMEINPEAATQYAIPSLLLSTLLSWCSSQKPPSAAYSLLQSMRQEYPAFMYHLLFACNLDDVETCQFLAADDSLNALHLLQVIEMCIEEHPAMLYKVSIAIYSLYGNSLSTSKPLIFEHVLRNLTPKEICELCQSLRLGIFSIFDDPDVAVRIMNSSKSWEVLNQNFAWETFVAESSCWTDSDIDSFVISFTEANPLVRFQAASGGMLHVLERLPITYERVINLASHVKDCEDLTRAAILHWIYSDPTECKEVLEQVLVDSRSNKRRKTSKGKESASTNSLIVSKLFLDILSQRISTQRQPELAELIRSDASLCKKLFDTADDCAFVQWLKSSLQDESPVPTSSSSKTESMEVNMGSWAGFL